MTAHCFGELRHIAAKGGASSGWDDAYMHYRKLMTTVVRLAAHGELSFASSYYDDFEKNVLDSIGPLIRSDYDELVCWDECKEEDDEEADS